MIYKEIINGKPIRTNKRENVGVFYQQKLVPVIQASFKKLEGKKSIRTTPTKEIDLANPTRLGEEAYFQVAMDLYNTLVFNKPLPNGDSLFDVRITVMERDYIINLASREVKKLDYQKLKLVFDLIPKYRMYYLFGVEEV